MNNIMSWRSLVECFNAFMKSVIMLFGMCYKMLLKNFLHDISFRALYCLFWIFITTPKTRHNVILKSVLVAFRKVLTIFFFEGVRLLFGFLFFGENLNIYCASLSSEKALWRNFTLIFFFIVIIILFYGNINYTDKISYVYFKSYDKLIICKYKVYVQKM